MIIPNVQIREQLEQLFVESQDFKEIERRRMGFCPFEALGMVHAEIRHSNFLASMMDPRGPHGLGSALLREVLDGVVAAIGDVEGLSRLHLHLLELNEADIRREWDRIDLLIAFPTAHLVFVFELKIAAEEGYDQLGRYRETVERRWPRSTRAPWQHLYLFLTRDGRQPTDGVWHAVTYDIIIDAIERTLERTAGGDPMARLMLKAYAKMLRKHHMDDQELAKLAHELWAKHKQALEYLMEQRPDGLASLGALAMESRDAIAKRASVDGLTLEPEESTRSYVRFYVKEWEPLQKMTNTSWLQSGRMLVIELSFRAAEIKAALILGQGPEDARERYLKLALPRRKLNPKWNTLVSQQLISASGSPADPETGIDELTERLASFLDGSIRKLDGLLQPLLDEARKAEQGA